MTEVTPLIRKRGEMAVQLTAGGIAGAVSRTVVSPLERVKILFQIQGAGQPKYTSVWQSLLTMYKEEGIRGYFKGNFTNCIRIFPYSAVQFATYEQVKLLIMRLKGVDDLTTPERLGAGAVAGVTSVATTFPLDIARTRLSISADASHGQRNMIKVMTHIYRHEGGIRALYRGLSPTCIGVAPYVAVNFAVYENMKLWFSFDGKPPSVFVKLFCGGMAGAVAQTLTYPLDLLRRRFQIMNIPGHTEFQYKSTLDGLMQIVKREGVPGLYKGCWPNYLKVAPAIAVSFVTYEQSKVWLEQLLH